MSLPSGRVDVVGRTSALVALVDASGKVVEVNPALVAATGVSVADLVGCEAAAVLCPARDATDLLRTLRVVGRTSEARGHEHDLPVADGRRVSVAWTTSVVADDPLVMACVGVDVTDARSAAEDLATRALTDELTGLPNRSHLLQLLKQMSSGSGASVLFCDLNGFKAVNDTFGHATGDAVLVEVARRLTLAVRGEDFVARLGGDEFVIVAPTSPTASPHGLGRRVLSAMRQPMLLTGGVVVVVGVSVGSADMHAGQDPAEVLQQADAQMYTSKSLRGSSEAALRTVGLPQATSSPEEQPAPG